MHIPTYTLLYIFLFRIEPNHFEQNVKICQLESWFEIEKGIAVVFIDISNQQTLIYHTVFCDMYI